MAVEAATDSALSAPACFREARSRKRADAVAARCTRPARPPPRLSPALVPPPAAAAAAVVSTPAASWFWRSNRACCKAARCHCLLAEGCSPTNRARAERPVIALPTMVLLPTPWLPVPPSDASASGVLAELLPPKALLPPLMTLPAMLVRRWRRPRRPPPMPPPPRRRWPPRGRAGTVEGRAGALPSPPALRCAAASAFTHAASQAWRMRSCCLLEPATVQ